jgi:hypothetical protein
MTTPVPVVDSSPLITAVKAAITGVALGEGKKPTVGPNLPYVVAWFDAGTVTNRSLRSRAGFEFTGVFQCYGTSPDSVRFAVRKVREGVAPLGGVTAGGRTLRVPSHSSTVPMDRDDDVQPPIWWQTDVWTFRT